MGKSQSVMRIPKSRFRMKYMLSYNISWSLKAPKAGVKLPHRFELWQVIRLLKLLRMDARALWRSGHAGLCLGRRPCTSRRRVQGRSQGTTLSASDLHNAQATIPNLFYSMECKMIKKIRQNTTWIGADLPSVNLTPNRYNALATAIFYVSNDVTIPTPPRHNSNTNDVTASAREWDRIVLKSTDRCSNLSIFFMYKG